MGPDTHREGGDFLNSAFLREWERASFAGPTKHTGGAGLRSRMLAGSFLFMYRKRKAYLT